VSPPVPSTVSPPGRDRPRVAIVGGGIIGMAIGWRLATAGCSVDVFERGKAGGGATWAAAGMLAAGVETEPGEQRLLPLTLASQRLWPDFAAALEQASGLAVELRDEGTLVVALTRDDVEALRTSCAFQRGLGIGLDWLTGAAAREREPFLNPRTAAAVYCRTDHQVDNRKVGLALPVALRKAGGRLHEGVSVDAVDCAAGRVTGLVAEGRRVEADIVVVAAGAWSRDLPGLPAAAVPPVRPVKGQMLALRMDPAQPLLRHVVWAPKCYLVPRRDGRLIVGATTEERGWDEQLTAGGVLALLEAAWRAVPGVEELPLDEMWVGFRPGSRDDAPILGTVAGVDGLVLATGHHRNGILLAPVTADAIARLVLDGTADPLIQPFGLARFQGSAAA
jgi:glycine oxidase